MKHCYVIVYMTEGFQDLSVFSSLQKAEEVFDKLVEKYGLTKNNYSYYASQAYRKVNNKKTTLTLMKKIINFNSI